MRDGRTPSFIFKDELIVTGHLIYSSVLTEVFWVLEILLLELLDLEILLLELMDLVILLLELMDLVQTPSI